MPLSLISRTHPISVSISVHRGLNFEVLISAVAPALTPQSEWTWRFMFTNLGSKFVEFLQLFKAFAERSANLPDPRIYQGRYPLTRPLPSRELDVSPLQGFPSRPDMGRDVTLAISRSLLSNGWREITGKPLLSLHCSLLEAVLGIMQPQGSCLCLLKYRPVSLPLS